MNVYINSLLNCFYHYYGNNTWFLNPKVLLYIKVDSVEVSFYRLLLIRFPRIFSMLLFSVSETPKRVLHHTYNGLYSKHKFCITSSIFNFEGFIFTNFHFQIHFGYVKFLKSLILHKICSLKNRKIKLV